MRTTVTVDPDVEQLLRLAMQRTGQGFKATLNQALRRGLADTVVPSEEPPFVVEAHDMGLRPGIDLADVHDFETELDVDGFLDVTRKLAERLTKREPSHGRSKP